MRAFFIISCLAFAYVSYALPSTSSYLTDNDRTRLRGVLDASWDLKDLASIHYGSLGYKYLGQPIPKPQDVCKFLATKTSEANAEALFHVSNAWQTVGSCGNLPSAPIVKRLNEVASNDASLMADLYYSILGLKALGQRPSDVAKVLKNVQAALKKDDSALSLGYAFHIAAAIGAEARPIFDRIQDALAQADEVDSRFLQFEGGLSITALVVSGAFNLASAQNRAPPLTHEQATKFANYFLSRRSVQTVKGVYSLLDILNILSSNKYVLPVAVSVEGSGAVSSTNPKILLKVSDVLGKPISSSAVSVTAESAKGAENLVILSKKKFEATSDKTVFALNVFEEKPAPGQYSLTVSAALNQADSRIPSNIVSTVTIKAMCAVTITSFEIGTADADQTTQPKMHKVTYPSKLPSVLEADSQQKIVVRFQLVAAGTNKPLVVHQAFLRLWNEKSKQEIIFNAEKDASKTYKFDMDIGAKDPDFGFLSGEFHVDLIVGDAIIINPLMWHVADLKLSPPSTDGKDAVAASNHAHLYRPKPEIKHIFREPEKRPAAVVSNLFTALVCLPLLLLLSLWTKLGINTSNFPCSLSAVGFHLGLTSIFGLFVVFWLELNMFTTVKYLVGLGALTFLSGNKMLAQIAARPKL